MALFLSLMFTFLLWCLNPVKAQAALGDLLVIPSPIPEVELSMQGVTLPPWKKLWDEGRGLVRAGDFKGGAARYDELLAVKPKLEEARWEFCWLLIRIGDWEQAVKNLELLCESYPEKSIYLNALAIALRGQGHFSRALDLFTRNYSRNSGDLVALSGMAQSLVEGGRKKEAYPLIKKIFDLKPNDRGVKIALASLAFEIGKLETARKLLVELAADRTSGLDILLMTARIHERLERYKTAVQYWQKILNIDPDHREARGRLAIYYENRGQYDKALEHLLSLLENDEHNHSLLAKICRIYVQTDRFAEALPYFERYVQLRPDDLDALRSIININIALGTDTVALYRRILAITPDDPAILNQLASDLLAAGQLEGALFMWGHISRLAPNRPEVFRAIADLLGRLGRIKEQVEALQLLHELVPEDMQVILKLAQMKRDSGELQESLEYYGKLQRAGYIGWALFEGRGQLHEELQQPAEALADYEKLLALSPNRNDIRRRCIVLAGELGDLVALAGLIEQLESSNFVVSPADLLLAAESYRKACDFGKAFSLYKEILGNFRDTERGDRPPFQRSREYGQAVLGLSNLLEEEGLLYEAEELLREYYLDSGQQLPVLQRLFDLSLSRRNVATVKARVWFDRYSSLAGENSARVKLMKARLLASVDELASAGVLTRQILQESVRGRVRSDPEGREVVRRAGLLLAEIYTEDGELADAERQCLALLGNDEVDKEVLVLLLRIYHIAEEREAAGSIFDLLISSSGGVLELLELAQLLKKYDLPGYQAIAAEKAMLEAPQSSRAGYLMALAMQASGRADKTIDLLRKLMEKYPENVSLSVLVAKGYFLTRENALSIEKCDEILERYPGRMDMEFLKARAVLATGNRAGVEQSRARLFPERTDDILARELAQAGLEMTVTKKKRSLWQVVTFSSTEQPGLAEQLMSAASLIDNATEKSRKTNSIAVRYFAQWNWEKAFGTLVSGS
ncbi:MAG: tetratricopeptide repeat protein [Proteobacteria bacterium]|nr:tetratricopeptide repeat protein [Pseudomonadota bacterium]MBU1736610.1 tetratricopeptide repeat protein [Pseudomonadota bacterium]